MVRRYWCRSSVAASARSGHQPSWFGRKRKWRSHLRRRPAASDECLPKLGKSPGLMELQVSRLPRRANAPQRSIRAQCLEEELFRLSSEGLGARQNRGGGIADRPPLSTHPFGMNSPSGGPAVHTLHALSPQGPSPLFLKSLLQRLHDLRHLPQVSTNPHLLDFITAFWPLNRLF